MSTRGISSTPRCHSDRSFRKCFLSLAPLLAFVLAACDGDSTNAPTDAEVEQAKQAQIAAIDKDPTMSPQDKERLKAAKGLIPGGPPGSSGKKGR